MALKIEDDKLDTIKDKLLPEVWKKYIPVSLQKDGRQVRVSL